MEGGEGGGTNGTGSNGANGLNIPINKSINILTNYGLMNGGGGGGGIGDDGGNGSGTGIDGPGGIGGPGIGGFAGGTSAGAGGGGGASGGGAGGFGTYSGGNGGYGISNDGTIGTLINKQGYTSSTKFIGGLLVFSIPLYITGKLPTNYQICIDDTATRYGQLYAKTFTGTSTFNIDPTSTITGLSVGGSKTYSNIANGNFFSNTSGTQTIGLNNYSWSIDGTNTLTITLSSIHCYNKDTLILTKIHDIEQYIKIQDLMPGDMIKTYIHGFKPLKYLLSANVISGTYELNSLYLIKKNTTNNLNEDLIITGNHLILVDNVSQIILKNKLKKKIYRKKIKIDDKECLLACDYPGAIRLNAGEQYQIYHLVLDGDNERYGIYVNGGFLSESTTEKILMKKTNILNIIKK